MSDEIRNYIGEEPLGCCFSDLSGRDFWKLILGSYWHVEDIDEALAFSLVQGVLLHGPYGSGKNTLLQAMAGEMVQGGYHYLEIDFQAVPKESVRKVFELLAQEYVGTRPLFIFISHLNMLKDAAVLWEFYAKANEGDYPVIIASAIEDETAIIPDIRKLFHAYWIDVPDREDRKSYFSDNLEVLFDNSPKEGMKKLLDATEGYNYIQLESLANQIKLRVKYAVLKEGKDLNIAMSWLEGAYIEEVLAKVKRPKVSDPNVGDLSALMQVLSNLPAGSTVQSNEPVQPKEKDPLEDLRAKYNPKKVFDQGLMFAKK